MTYPVEHWNTGRLYTKHGQLIVAQVQDDRTVLFADLSRNIDGRITAEHIRYNLRDHVMFCYDHNDYRPDKESHSFYGRVHFLASISGWR